MKIFNDLLLKFEKPDWSVNPEFCVIDTMLESRPDLILMLRSDIIGSDRPSTFGRQDTPSVEQIVRAAIYKEMKGMDYRELEYAQSDSRICETFIKLDDRNPFSFQGFRLNAGDVFLEHLKTKRIAIIQFDKGLTYPGVTLGIF